MKTCNKTNDKTDENNACVYNTMTDFANFDFIPGISTGFDKLDDVLCGLHGGDLIVVGGWVKMGKTLFATSLLKNICIKQKIPALMFSIQHNTNGVIDRIMANLMHIKLHHFFSGQLEDTEWKKLDTLFPELNGAPLYINDDVDVNIDQIIEIALLTKKEKGIQLVVIDSLSLIRNNHDRINNKYEEITDTIRELKSLARKANVPIIVTCGLNRKMVDNDPRMTIKPDLSLLRDSGCIEEMADVVLFINRPEELHIYHDDYGNDLRGVAQIIVAKNSCGKCDELLLDFEGDYACFKNQEETYVTFVDGLIESKLNTISD